MDTVRPTDTRARQVALGSAPRKDTSPPLQPSLSQENPNSSEAVRSQAAQAADLAASLAEDLKDAAKTAGRAVQEQAAEFAANVGQELTKATENQKMRGVDAIQCFASAIRSAARELERQSPQMARAGRDAASKVEGLSQNLSSHSVDELVSAASDLARSQPMLFVGGAVAAGFAMARFFKSSADNRPTPRTQSMGTASPSGAMDVGEGEGAKFGHSGMPTTAEGEIK